MTMQKSGQNLHSQRQQQYVRPESPSPSSVKKSPLAMLVDACSSIGQELTKTAKPTDAMQFDLRKGRGSTSPASSGSSSKPNSPPPPYSHQQRLGAASALSSSRSALTSGSSLHQHHNKEQLSAAASLAASQYQLMYQQLLYQAELEYIHRSKETTIAAPHRATGLKEPQLAKSASSAAVCSMCSLTPGYTPGSCVHDTANASSLNQMLAMLNPGSAAAAVLAYSSKLSSLNQTYPDSPMAGVYPSPASLRWDSSRKSPPSLSVESSRRSSANSTASTLSPRQSLHSPRDIAAVEQPMDLQVQKPQQTRTTQLIECHWVGAEGYCGKRFHSQEDLMSHLKHHVITCPNVTHSEADDRGAKPSSRQPLRSPPSAMYSSFKSKTSSAGAVNLSPLMSKHSSPSARFHPYSLSERAFPSSLVLTPR